MLVEIDRLVKKSKGLFTKNKPNTVKNMEYLMEVTPKTRSDVKGGIDKYDRSRTRNTSMVCMKMQNKQRENAAIPVT